MARFYAGYYKAYPDYEHVDLTIWVKRSKDWRRWHYIIVDVLGRVIEEHEVQHPEFPQQPTEFYLQVHEATMSNLLKNAMSKQETAKPVTGIAEDTRFAEEFPVLTEFLTTTMLDNKPRQTATLYVFVHDGVWKAFLNDRHTQRCITVSADTFATLPEALERQLNADEPGWREMTGGATRKPKR